MGKQHTIEQVAEALKIARGYVSVAARAIDVTPQAIYKRIKNDEKLQEVLREIDEERLDRAENELELAVEGKDAWAVKYTLDNKGRSRGYGKQVIEQTNKNETVDPNQHIRDMSPTQRKKRLAELRERQGVV